MTTDSPRRGLRLRETHGTGWRASGPLDGLGRGREPHRSHFIRVLRTLLLAAAELLTLTFVIGVLMAVLVVAAAKMDALP